MDSFDLIVIGTGTLNLQQLRAAPVSMVRD
jgi:hypothetical protein